MREIEKCPLCGSEVDYKVIGHYHKEVCVLEQHQIRCKCGLTFEARISPTIYRHKEFIQEFIDNWNGRTRIDSIIERLKRSAFPDYEEEYSCDGQQMLFLSDAIEAVKGGGLD